MAAKKSENVEIVIDELKRGRMTIRVVGESPLIHNRLSEKAKRQLLLPKGRMTVADKATNLKHDSLNEYRDSVYRKRSEVAPDRPIIFLPQGCFKGALKTTALDIPGASKAQIGRLVYVVENDVPVWGVPQLYMAIVRSADMNHTPDVRTRAIMPRWAAEFTLSFMKPNLGEKSLLNLMAASGEICGVGDWRPSKGAGAFGRYRLVGADDPEWNDIVAEGSVQQQVEALDDPYFYDDDTAELFGWFETEAKTRGKEVDAKPSKSKTKSLESEGV